MPRQIIKQPNGKFCLFSTVVDNVIYYDMEETDIIEVFVSDYREQITKDVKGRIEKLNNGEKPYHIFTLSYEQMIEKIKEIDGEEEANKINKLLTATETKQIESTYLSIYELMKDLKQSQLIALLKEIRKLGECKMPKFAPKSDLLSELFEIENKEYYDFSDKYLKISKAIDCEIANRIMNDTW